LEDLGIIILKAYSVVATQARYNVIQVVYKLRFRKRVKSKTEILEVTGETGRRGELYVYFSAPTTSACPSSFA
jgi:hypothetical protein